MKPISILKVIILTSAILLSLPCTIQSKELVILHTNDTHSQIDPMNDGYGGVARRKVVIDSVRAKHENVLLIDAGDVVQGTLFFNVYKGELEEKLMNLLGYDVRILGNHEFDNGMDLLADNIRTSNAKWLSANYQTQGTPLEGLFEPYTIYEIEGKRIALIGINLIPDGMISACNSQGIKYVDGVETAQSLAWCLKNIGLADLVIAVTHIGYPTSCNPSDIQLARESHDIDIIIGGHSHTTIDPRDPASSAYLLPNADMNDILVAQTGSRGKNIGQITIDLDNISAIPEYELIRIDSRLDDRIDTKVEEIIQPYRSGIDSINAKIVGKVAKDLDKDGAALLNFTCDFIVDRGRDMAENVDFGLINKGALRNSIPKGDISEGQIISLMPFYNRIQVVDISGENIIKAFEVMTYTGGNGLSSELDITFDPDTHKCVNVLLNGKPFDPNRTYRVALNDYIANGGDYMSSLKDHTLVAQSTQPIFDDMIDYLKNGKYKGKTIDPSDKPRMRSIK